MFVDVDLRIEVGDDGTPKRLHFVWTFDDMYSAFAIQGLGGPGGKPSAEELTALAKVNVEQLEETNYFTSMRASLMVATNRKATVSGASCGGRSLTCSMRSYQEATSRSCSQSAIFFCT